MNDFESHAALAGGGLCCVGVDVVQVNVGLRCNQRCVHCHVEASPDRTEQMEWPVMAAVIEAASVLGARRVDITGGSPELNPRFTRLVTALKEARRDVQVRTNLTVLAEAGMGDIPEFLRRHEVALVASLPCYLAENVNAQRGGGCYAKSVEVIRMLNDLGYGRGGLQLDLVCNPAGPFLPPPQAELEADYRGELTARFGVTFSRLLTITNMPIGRFGRTLERDGKDTQYLRLLKDAFNPAAIEGLMCRHQLSVGWDGTLYDCDFNLALGLPVDHGAPDHITRFDSSRLQERRIVTRDHCFGCTAGSGSSCGGALV